MIFPSLLRENVFELFYTDLGQEISVANYWNDPNHQDLYYKYNTFLTSLNNEVMTPFSDRFKKSLLKLNNFVLIGGPDDGVIEPWQSRYVLFHHFFQFVYIFRTSFFNPQLIFNQQFLNE